MRATCRALVVLWAALAGGCAASPTTPAPSPTGAPAAPVAVLTILAGGATDLAIGGFTRLTFDASASTGADLSYQIEFGDGQTTTSAVSSHQASDVAAGQDGERRTARLTVTDRLGRSHSVTQPYYVVNLDSPFPWYTTPQGHGFTLRLDNTSLTGWHGSWENGRQDDGRPVSRRIVGRLTGTHGIDVETEGGHFGFRGTVVWATPPSDAGPGGMWKENVRLRLTVRGGVHDGQTLDFRWNDPY